MPDVSAYERFLERLLEPVEQPSPFERFVELLFAEPAEPPMRSYQRYLADKIVELPGLLAAAEMSLGKSRASLMGAKRVLLQHPRHRILIVAPLAVAQDTWPEELRKWSDLRDLTWTLVVGNEAERSAALAVDAQVTITNRESLPWLLKKIGGKGFWRWTILIYDESSRLKAWRHRTAGDKKAGATKKPAPLSGFGVLAHVRSKFEKIVLLSGTPAPNGVIDLGGQAYILDGGVRLGHSRKAFLDRWFDQNPYSYSVEPKPHARDEIMGLLKDVMIGLRAEDYIDLPPRMFNPVYVRLPQKIMKQYKEFEDTLYAEQYDVEAVSKGVLTNKLLQFANGSLYRPIPETDPPRKEIIPVHDHKLEALERIIEEASGQPVLIAYGFKFDLARIKKKYPEAVVFDDDPNFVRNWNAGKIKIGVAHPASMSHGLNLQFGGHIQVWYGLTWSLELWDQFNRRCARPGQKSPVVIIHVIMARKTEDERQYMNLMTKGITQDQITNSVRIRLNCTV